MGAEAACTVRFGRQTSAGKARLETSALEFRGDFKLSIRFDAMSNVSSRDGILHVRFAEGTAAFDLGAAAALWERKIRNPPTRLQKLGIKPTWRASAVSVEDEAFLKELQAAVAQLSIGRVLKDSDAIFFGAKLASALTRLAALKRSIKADGAIWVIRPKGRPEISEQAVMAAGKAAGLVDVKVVGFSATHTAEKFVIPVAARRAR